MPKSPEMEKMLSAFSKSAFGRQRGENQCVTCGAQVNPEKDLRDALSYKEWTISYMCQECQDMVFGPAPNEG